MVFVDTAGWLALLNSRDGLHTQALSVQNSLRQRRVRLITTEFVLIEVADAFAAPPLRALTVEFYKGLRQANTPEAVEIIPVSEDLLAKERSITEAFTSDHHFTQAGFTALLSHEP